MSKHELSKLLEKYKLGRCSGDEEDLVKGFMDSFQGNNEEWDEDLLGNKQEIEEKIYAKISLRLEKTGGYQRSSSLSFWGKVAAAVLIIVGSYFIYNQYRDFNLKEVKTEIFTRSTAYGERSTIQLSDGTSIILNAGSKVIIPKVFKGGRREVELIGEAYFDVTSDPDFPFVVKTGNICTTVLGTKFNVNAFPGENVVKVSLVEGKVKVRSEADEIFNILPEQQIIINKEDNSTELKEFNVMEVIGWKDNMLIFKDEPLKNVLKSLARAYGVDLVLEDSKDGMREVTTEFNDVSIRAAAKLIQFSTGLDYRMEVINNQIARIIFFNK